MKQFTTITELQILYDAYHAILDRWVKAEKDYSKSILEGSPNEIAKGRRDKYNAQLAELHEAILDIERAE